jgi:predicted small secreted protein
MIKTVLLATVLTATLLLGACNTMEGAGEDISNGGHDLTHAASDSK